MPGTARVHLLEEVQLHLPFWRYYEAFEAQPYSALLDSALQSERLGRYSFIAADPFLVLRAKRVQGAPLGANARIEVLRSRAADGSSLHAPVRECLDGDFFEELRHLLREYRLQRGEYSGLPAPFLAGAIGYIGYEAGYFIEDLPDSGLDDLGLPEVCLGFYDQALVHDHASGQSWLSVVGRGCDSSEAERRARRTKREWLRQVRSFEGAAGPPACSSTGDPAAVEVLSHFNRESYWQAVRTVKEYIQAGRVYEVCLTQRLESPFAGPPWRLYQELRRINPAPFAAYLKLPEAAVVCASPERFLRLDAEGIAESRPIKGTRPRGATPEADEALRRELAASEKDRAENLMIVDLVRNDLGRVARIGSIEVPELMAVEEYATVFQMVSTVRARLDHGRDAIDLIRACFPGGSMTGAPKIEAMKVIDSLEPVKRGIYSGAIGYIDFSGTLDLNIVIRSAVVKDGRCYYGVGGAIVADSEPAAEYEEAMHKARATIAALANLRE